MRCFGGRGQRDRGGPDAGLGFGHYSIPSSSRASSLILVGSHGGSHTSLTSASRMPGTAQDAQFDFARHRFGDRAMRRGQRHRHHRVALGADGDVVDQAQFVDVDRDFRVVDRLQRLDDRLDQRCRRAPTGRARAWSRRGSPPDSRACARSSGVTRARGRASRPRRLPRSRSCFPRSSENPLNLVEPAHQRLDIRFIAVRREARARGRGDAEQVHQRLRAMMAGADRDALVVQYGADVVRMNPVEREADDSGAVLGAEQASRP